MGTTTLTTEGGSKGRTFAGTTRLLVRSTARNAALEATKTAQEAPTSKRAQDAAETAKDAPRSPLDSLNGPPRGLRDGPKGPQECSKSLRFKSNAFSPVSKAEDADVQNNLETL